jgi:hypothetical protein
MKTSATRYKHVQTELSEDEYERFRELGREHGLSFKETEHEALVESNRTTTWPSPVSQDSTVSRLRRRSGAG